jgi:citrate synthase
MKPKVDLTESEENWQTELGGSIPGERVVVRGKDLFSELCDFSWHKMLLLMITGREFEDKTVELLDKMWAHAINYPDPRVWNNRIAALAGTARSTAALGVSAGAAATEAKIYGGQATLDAFTFIVDCADRIDRGENLSDILRNELKTNRVVFGYGRPIVRVDERIKPIQKLIEKYGHDGGKHVRLAYQVDAVLKRERWRLQMNIAGLAAAIGADIGFSAREYYLWLVNGYNAGIVACYGDASSKEEGKLFPLRCERIVYSGVPARAW